MFRTNQYLTSILADLLTVGSLESRTRTRASWVLSLLIRQNLKSMNALQSFHDGINRSGWISRDLDWCLMLAVYPTCYVGPTSSFRETCRGSIGWHGEHVGGFPWSGTLFFLRCSSDELVPDLLQSGMYCTEYKRMDYKGGCFEIYFARMLTWSGGL